MRKILILMSCTIMLLSGCEAQNSQSQSIVSSTDGNGSQVQTDIFESEIDDVQTRQVLIKRTKYDEADNVLEWQEYNYETENQSEQFEYDADGKLLMRVIEEYDNDWNRIKRSGYNEFDILVYEIKYNSNGDTLYYASYSENGTLEYECNYTYNEDGTENSETIYEKSSDGERRYVINTIYNENGAPLRETTEDLITGEKYNSKLYSCDGNGNIIEEKWYFTSGDMQIRFSNEYDENGRVIKTESEHWVIGNWTSTYTYDDAGNRLTYQSINPSSPDDDYSTVNTYDKNGNCLTEKTTYPSSPEKNSLITNVYDENGFILRETHDESGGTWYYLYEYDMIPVISK